MQIRRSSARIFGTTALIRSTSSPSVGFSEGKIAYSATAAKCSAELAEIAGIAEIAAPLPVTGVARVADVSARSLISLEVPC